MILHWDYSCTQTIQIFLKNNPNVFSLICSIVCLILSFVWSTAQGLIFYFFLIFFLMNVTIWVCLVQFWKTELYISAVSCRKLTPVEVKRQQSKWHTRIQRSWYDDSRLITAQTSVIQIFCMMLWMLPYARLQWWIHEGSDSHQGREHRMNHQEILRTEELKFWLGPLDVCIMEISNNGT